MKPTFRFLPLITALFVTTLIVSNIIAVKLVNLAGLFAPAGIILFPLAYFFGDVLTEVYGFARARQVIWTGFACNFLAVLAIGLAGVLPAAPFWTDSPAWETILGFSPRLLAASFVAYLVGEFLNSFVLAKLKIWTNGRFLWIRTIGSTMVGEGVDSALFISLAFWGVMPGDALGVAILTQWALKVGYEVLATPFTYWIVRSLKKAESQDAYDRGTPFNPFRFRTDNGSDQA